MSVPMHCPCHDNPAVTTRLHGLSRRGRECQAATRACAPEWNTRGFRPRPRFCPASRGMGLSQECQAAAQLHAAPIASHRPSSAREPGDYRVAHRRRRLHLPIIAAAQRTPDVNRRHVLGRCVLHNGVLPFKRYIIGEAYTSSGQAAGIEAPCFPTLRAPFPLHGVIPKLQALPQWGKRYRRQTLSGCSSPADG